jgi:peptide/nickel transport system ATP-binding protein
VLATSLEARGADEGNVLEIDTVRRTFKDGKKKLTAVADVSLDLRKGETFGLVGESGSGKTTLAKCVTGLLAPDAGTITFEAGVLRPTAARRSQDALRAIQMVFQNPDSTLNPAWSTRAILTRAVRKLGGGKAGSVRAKVDKLSADVRVEPRFLMQRPTELSGGQKQRVAIARAFAGDPTLVICDEPASALDVSVQASILNLLVELQTNEKVSYVFISHDLAVVRYISDRIGVMYLAELIELGAAEEVFNPPHHPYTEALLSSIPKLDFDSPRRRIELRGTMPSLSEPPSGCRFHTRCHRLLGDICKEQEPPFQESQSGHRYKCHIPPGELLAAQLADRPDAQDEAVAQGADTPGTDGADAQPTAS